MEREKVPERWKSLETRDLPRMQDQSPSTRADCQQLGQYTWVRQVAHGPNFRANPVRVLLSPSRVSAVELVGDRTGPLGDSGKRRRVVNDDHEGRCEYDNYQWR